MTFLSYLLVFGLGVLVGVSFYEKEKVKKVWEFLKVVWEKVVNFFKNLFKKDDVS